MTYIPAVLIWTGLRRSPLSDGHGIQGLTQGIVEARPEGRTVVEEAPKDSKGSNGEVERAVQEVEGTMRSLFLALEERLGRGLDARERIVAFMPEYASYLINRLSYGQDGMVAYERIKGRSRM